MLLASVGAMGKTETTWAAAWASEGKPSKKGVADDEKVSKAVICCCVLAFIVIFYAGIYFHHSEHWDFEFADHHFQYLVVPAIVVFVFAMEGRQILKTMKQACGLPVTVRHED